MLQGFAHDGRMPIKMLKDKTCGGSHAKSALATRGSAAMTVIRQTKNILTNAGVSMPRLLYGTAWKGEHTAALVANAVRAGFRGIDTAAQPKHYDEAGVGAGLATGGLPLRAALYLQTKFTPPASQDRERLPYLLTAPLASQIEQSVVCSRHNLRTTYLDALVLHSPLESRARTLLAWRAMEQLVGSGAVRQLGISNCYGLAEFDALYRAAEIKPAVLQNRFYARTRHDRELRAYCRAHGVVYQSFWTLTANPDALASSTLRILAQRHGRTPAQILFRYLTHIDVVPLTGTSSPEHMCEDLAIFEFELEARECDALSVMF